MDEANTINLLQLPTPHPIPHPNPDPHPHPYPNPSPNPHPNQGAGSSSINASQCEAPLAAIRAAVEAAGGSVSYAPGYEPLLTLTLA